MRARTFYEVTDHRGEVEYGSASPSEAITWWKRGPGKTIYLSIWDEEDVDDFKLITDRIDITPSVSAAIASERGRG
jgi:hypothetical protein